MVELQVVQRRHEDQLIAGQAFAGLTDKHILDTPMNTFAIEAKLEKGRLTEQAFQIEVRLLADQLDRDRIQGAEGFGAVKRQHLEIIANRGDQ
ncbi:hypothetical protein D3C80_1931740 [compost metagenome]